MHHPEKHLAPADEPLEPMAPYRDDAHPLGILPHQLRGFIGTFAVVQSKGLAFKHCTACSPSVCGQYRSDPFGTLASACNDARYLERVSGLEAFQRETEQMIADFDLEYVDF